MNALKNFLFASLVIAALSAVVVAQTETASNAPPKHPSTATTTAPPAPPAATMADIQVLRDALAAQQKQIEALQAQLRSRAQGDKDDTADTANTANTKEQPSQPAEPTTAAVSPSPATSSQPKPQATPAPPQGTQVAQPFQAGSSDERIRNLERQIKGLGPISFSGDIRLRGEPFFGGPSNESLDRVRGRVRARFNAFANLGDQFQAGITLASGDINDPTSTNQTLTGFYTRKTVALDQAFIQFTPKAFKPLTLVGGKFRYPWYNTELTWDKDLNPEGAAQTLSFNVASPVLKRIAFVGFELPFAELAGTSSTDQRITQAITYGGQIQTGWSLGPRVTLNAYSGYYDFRGSDAIAVALARASSKNPQTPLSGVLPLTSGNPVQDSTYTTTATTIVTVDGTTYPTGVTSITSAQFASKFGLFDNIARLDIDTGHARIPISFIGDYVQNTAACGNLPNITAAPANTATATYKQTVNSPCNSHYRRGYWAETSVGRLQKKGDFQFGYARIYIEREAVLGNFNYSDIRQGTNVTQHRFTSFYQFDSNVQLGFTALVGRPLGTTEPWLTRLQFDSIYIF
jgi:hypothetical protein